MLHFSRCFVFIDVLKIQESVFEVVAVDLGSATRGHHEATPRQQTRQGNGRRERQWSKGHPGRHLYDLIKDGPHQLTISE